MAEKITAETIVGSTELAGVLGLSVRRIQQLTQDSILVTASRGKYELCDNVQRYITYISDGQLSEDEIKIEKTRRMAEAQIKAAKATVAKLEANELQGKMHRSEDVQAITEAMVTTLRSMLVALPGRLAVDVTNASSAAEASIIIRDEVYKVMEEMSRFEYDPSKYEERVRDRRKWEQQEQDATTDDDEL